MTQLKTRYSMASNLLALALGLSMAAGFIAGAEYLGARLLKARGQTVYPLFFCRPPAIETRSQDWGTLVLSYLDPHLGFAASPARAPLIGEIPGFVRYGPANAELRIVCIGGSTTDAYTPMILHDPTADQADPYNWPRDLQRLLGARGISAVVYNGGTAGYASSQDLIKLIRDGLSLKPSIVIALEGVNDLGHILSEPEHPHVLKYQRATLASITAQPPASSLLPNLATLLVDSMAGRERGAEGYSLGIPQQVHPAEHWWQNARTAHAICEEFRVKYLCLLQPIQGFGPYTASATELEKLQLKHDRLADTGLDYLPAVTEFYRKAQTLSSGTPWCVDLTAMFVEDKEVYIDATHQNAHGTQRLAERIFAELLNRAYIELPASTP